MESLKRATIYLDASLHRALRMKAAETDRSISDLVNDAVQQSLREDALDLEAAEKRAKAPSISFEAVVRDRKRRRKL